MISLKKIEKNIINNKLLFGIFILILNISSKNVSMSLSPMQKYILDNIYTRQIIIFCTIFIATKDLKVSFILTGTFYILSSHLLHEDSYISLIPKELKNAMDINGDNIITEDEIERAITTLNKLKSNTSNGYHTQDMTQMLS